MFRPPRNARLEVLPKVHNISGIEVPIIGDLVLTDVEPVVEVKNESLSDLSTLPPPSPETWLKKFYRKRIFPRRLNFEPTEPLRPDSTESNRMWTSDVAEDPFGKLSLENNATTSSKDDKTSIFKEITVTPVSSTTTASITDAVKDYEYIVFVDDTVKFKNFEYEEDYDSAILPESDFNTINMLNDFFKISENVGLSHSHKPKSNDESMESTTKSEEEIKSKTTLLDTETESSTTIVPDTVSPHNLEPEETTSKLFDKLAELIFEESTPATTESVMESGEEDEIPTTLLSIDHLVTTEPRPNSGENVVDTEASVEQKKLKLKASKLARFAKLKKKKGYRDQIEHFYQSKNSNFEVKIRDLAPFKNDFNFHFGEGGGPVEDIQNKMVEILEQSSSKSLQLESAQRSTPNIFQQQHHNNQQQVSFDGFEIFGNNFQEFPSPITQPVFSQFDDFRSTTNLLSSLASPRERRIAFRVPESVKNDLIYRWINTN